VSRVVPKQIRRILVITLSNLGDIVLTTPVISFLREEFPFAHLSVVVGPKGVSLLRSSLSVDDVILFNKRASWSDKMKWIWQLRKRHFDLVVDLRNTLIPWLIRARYRTPLRFWRSSAAMRDQHLARLKPLMKVPNRENNFDFYSHSEREISLAKARRYHLDLSAQNHVIIAPGAGSLLKRWTADGFQEVINHFLKSDFQVTLVGDEGERPLGFELEGRSIKPIANLIGKLTLREVAALVSQAELVIANDSAIMHIAHELNQRTVSLFGPTSEKKYGRSHERFRTVRLNLSCTPCERAQCHLVRRACLDDLPAKTVIDACEELLNHAIH
jgi:ADP-heptose:LPS heptosyltransferase